MAHRKVIKREDGKFLESITKVKTDLGTWVDSQPEATIFSAKEVFKARMKCIRRGVKTTSIIIPD